MNNSNKITKDKKVPILPTNSRFVYSKVRIDRVANNTINFIENRVEAKINN